MVIIGDGAVGKTSLLVSYSMRRFPTGKFVVTCATSRVGKHNETHLTDPQCNAGYVPTVFDNFEAVCKHDGKEYLLALWDTAGQEEYDHLRPISYPETDLFIMCFSLTSETSLTHLKQKWCPEIAKHAPSVPFIVVGTKSDLRDSDKAVSKSVEELESFARDLGAFAYVESSALNMVNVDRVFELGMAEVAKNPAISNPTLAKKASSGHLSDSGTNTASTGGCCIIS